MLQCVIRRGRPTGLLVLLLVASLLGLPGAAMPRAEASSLPGPSAASPAPAIGYVGSVSLTPDHGPAGTMVTVKGTDMPDGAQLKVVWNTVKGSWVLAGTVNEAYKGRQFDPVAAEAAEATVDQNGSLTATFRVPEDFGFLHDVTITEDDGTILNKAAFHIDPTASTSPARGPVGTPIQVTLNGVGYQYLYNVWQLVYDNKFTGWISSVTTQGKAVMTIPAAGPPGKHLVQIMAGMPDYPYLNTQQSPTPDRTTFTFIFEVTDGQLAVMPPAEAQGLPAVAGQPPSGAEAALWTDLQRAKVGASVVLNGRGLPPDQDVQLTWYRVVGNRISSTGWSEQAASLGAARTGPDGTIRLPFAVPDDLGGPHRIVASTGDKTVAEGTFTITPSALPISPASGPAGTEFSVRLKGGGWTETANIYTVVYDNAYLGYACAFSSQGDLNVRLPAAGPPGWHFIDLYPAIYKGEDIQGVSNFRVPQLTYEQDHPGEELPAFHFAFKVTE